MQASVRAIAPTLSVVDGKPTTTSTQIAQHFGKQHRNVLQAIDSLLPQLGEMGLLNFQQGVYTLPETGDQQHKLYTLTRDGFTLLAMGFTGKKALQFKLAYIDAFNRMERELRSPAPALPTPEPTAIDPRALLLSGQSRPTLPLPEAVQRAISSKAHSMALEAYELCREHLERRVAFTCEQGHPRALDAQRALKEVARCTLGHALAHQHHTELHWISEQAKTMQYSANKFANEMQAISARTPAHTSRHGAAA